MTPPPEERGRRDNVDEVRQRVRDAILDGEIAPGSVMSQVTLANQLGVSRTPLREALRMLQSEGLVDAPANRRVTVKPISATDLEELAVMRVALESEAVRLSVPRLTPENLAHMEGRLAEMGHFDAMRDYVRWVVPHSAFHRTLTSGAGGRVNAMLGHLFDHAERYRRLHVFGSATEGSATATHRAILDAGKAGERELAAQLLAEHLSTVAFDVMELLEPGYDASRLRQTLVDMGVDLATEQ